MESKETLAFSLNFDRISFLLERELRRRQKEMDPKILLYRILFKNKSLNKDEAISDLDSYYENSLNDFSYQKEFKENMIRLRQMIAKGQITIFDLHEICFSEKTLREVLCQNYYFPLVLTKL